MTLVDEVEQAARGGDHNVHTASQRCHLFALGYTAKDDSVVDFLVLAVFPDAVSNLRRQFSRGTQYQCADGPSLFARRLIAESVQHGKRERGSLAGARLGDTKYISPIDNIGDGLCLNGRRNLIAEGLEGTHEGFAQSERMEIGQIGRIQF